MRWLAPITPRVDDKTIDRILRNLDERIRQLVQFSSGVARLDATQVFTRSQRSVVTLLNDAATVSIDAAESNVFSLRAGATASRKLGNPANIKPGMTWQVWFQQDGVGGRAVTFGTYYDFGTEGVPDFSAQAADIKNIITFVALSTTQVAGTTLYGFAA